MTGRIHMIVNTSLLDQMELQKLIVFPVVLRVFVPLREIVFTVSESDSDLSFVIFILSSNATRKP
jgi:hypothetical protein